MDDPIRSREDADSDRVRERVWEWYKGDLSPRMKPGGRQIVIQTRWHEADLAGRLLEEMERGGDRWEVLSLPAEAEANDPLGRAVGEILWDDSYGYGDFLRHEKATQLPRNWSALYQQKPTPDTGDYFKAEWLKPYDKAPARATLTTYGASDYAVTDNAGDFTVHLVVGIDPEDNIYLLDLWREQSSPDKWVESFCDLVNEWKPLDWAEEQGQIKASRRSVSRQAAARTQSVCEPHEVSDPRRQGGARPIDPRPHGAVRLACTDPGILVSGVPRRAFVVSGGQARRPGGRARADRPVARSDGGGTIATAEERR